MRLKTLISTALATALAVTTLIVPQSVGYAAESFATPNDLIADVLDISLTGITSTTLGSALASAEALITTNGDKVLYDGVEVGYWYSDASTSIYADAAKTTSLVEKTSNGYTVDPTLLKTILTDVNEGITETYTPTTEDWSKIIGKYDVKLGSKTIPKEQWIAMDIQASDDWSNTNNLTNFTSITGKNVGNLGIDLGSRGSDSTETVNIKAWVVDVNGNMYISNGLEVLTQYPVHNGYPAEAYFNIDTLSTQYTRLGTLKTVVGSQTLAYANVTPYIKIKLVQGDESHNNYLMPEVFFTDVGNTNALAGIKDDPWNQDDLTLYELRNIADPAEIYSGDLQNIKASGILWLTGAQLGLPTGAYQATWHNAHTSMFDSFSASKTVTGNKTLSKRISTLGTLAASDTLEVATTGWTVNGTTSIDDYLAMQTIAAAGDVADITAVADVDALGFNVIVPTALPIQVDSSNIVYVASNADITNKSGAAVKLTGVEIVPKADSGWTSVDTPSKVPDTHEFHFATTIELNTVIDIDGVYPFEYSAKLSPTTTAETDLELASVFVTVDWAM